MPRRHSQPGAPLFRSSVGEKTHKNTNTREHDTGFKVGVHPRVFLVRSSTLPGLLSFHEAGN